MLRLIGDEARRFIQTRALWVASALMAAAIAIGGVVAFGQHQGSIDPEIRKQVDRSQEIQEEAEADCRAEAPPEEFPGCELDDLEPGDVSLPDARFLPKDIWEELGVDPYLENDGPVPDAPNEGEQGGLMVVLVTWPVLMAVAGALFVRSEPPSPSPRSSLLGARYVAAGGVAAVGAVVMSALLWLVLAPSLLWRGATIDMGVDFWLGMLAAVGRGAIVAGLVTVMAMALTSLVRSALGGLAILFLGSIAVEVLIRTVDGPVAYLPPTNLIAFLLDADVSRAGDFITWGVHHGRLGALGISLVVTAAVVGLSWVVAKRREVVEA